MSVGFIEVWPAEDDHVEDDDEAVKYRERCHLPVLMRMMMMMMMRTKIMTSTRIARQ